MEDRFEEGKGGSKETTLRLLDKVRGDNWEEKSKVGEPADKKFDFPDLLSH